MIHSDKSVVPDRRELDAAKRVCNIKRKEERDWCQKKQIEKANGHR